MDPDRRAKRSAQGVPSRRGESAAPGTGCRLRNAHRDLRPRNEDPTQQRVEQCSTSLGDGPRRRSNADDQQGRAEGIDGASTGDSPDVKDAAEIMVNERIRCLSVDGCGVVGVITRRDLVRTVGAHSDRVIAAEIRERLDRLGNPDRFSVAVQGGVVDIDDYVDGSTEHVAAQDIAMSTPGVVSVTVTYPHPRCVRSFRPHFPTLWRSRASNEVAAACDLVARVATFAALTPGRRTGAAAADPGRWLGRSGGGVLRAATPRPRHRPAVPSS